MKYLLFDKNAVTIIIGKNVLQSVEYAQGNKFVQHLRGQGESEMLEDVYVAYDQDGIFFVGKKLNDSITVEHNLFCIDLTTCEILEEKNDADLLAVVQRALRAVLKIWNRQPFTSSERTYKSKSVVFPFVMPDHRAIVIERAVNCERLTKRNIMMPLLAFKYSDEDPHGTETVNTEVFCKAGVAYVDKKPQIVRLFPEKTAYNNDSDINAIGQVTGGKLRNKESFAYWGFDEQYDNLTESQKYVVDFKGVESPLRIDGAAGTGKTFSLIMRAYKLLIEKKKNNEPFSIVFFTHSISTCEHDKAIFCNYPYGDGFLSGQLPQRIIFTTLLDYCREFAKIPREELLDLDAANAKTDQLGLIESALEEAQSEGVINTYKPLLSTNIKDLFNDMAMGAAQNICSLLQHEFSVQIKGRTDLTFDEYKDLQSLENGLYCQNEKDKEFVFRLFNMYQAKLRTYNYYDVDDVTIQALALLNAPIWRRRRAEEGFDYILVDEMHLFNINEQSVFHFLTKDYTKKIIPICFALDYCQAIGDHGNTAQDYIETAFGEVKKTKYKTIFRNSPKIAHFCASVAASGVLMFQDSFRNPYESAQNNFTDDEERKSQTSPILYMYSDDSAMLESLGEHLDELMQDLQCKQKDIAIISFEMGIVNNEGALKLSELTQKNFSVINSKQIANDNEFVLASAYDINGLEFQAVILLGVDEGRVPQTIGTSDLSQHYLRYSAFNLLYLAASRAKYRLILLGSHLNGRSSCLEHSLKSGYLVEDAIVHR